MSLLLGTIALLDLRLLGWWSSMPVSRLAPAALAIARAGFFIAVASGLLLFIARAADYFNHPVFWIKLGLLGAALLNVALVHRLPGWQSALEDRPAGGSIRFFAFCSLLLWIAVLSAGRLIGYR